jgi:hypothetical protein
MSDAARKAPPRIFIMIENPKKSNNLGAILRCGAAYSATFVFIGYQKCAIDGSHGASKHVEIVSFPTFQQASDYVKGCGVTSIVGILGDASFKRGSLDDDRAVFDDDKLDAVNVSAKLMSRTEESKYPCSRPIHLRPFQGGGNICFLISKRYVGIPKDQGKYCDAFVHVSTSTPFQTEVEDGHADGDGDDAIYGLLDSQTTLSICLHHFAAFAGYEERDFTGQKFVIADREKLEEEQIQILRQERLQKKVEAAQAADDMWVDGGMMNLFDM